MFIRDIEGDADEDQPGQIAEALLNSLVQVASELVVLPEHHDLALRMEGLDVIGVDASSARNDGCQPIVQGNAFGLLNSSSPEATKSWGIFRSFKKFRTARLPGVPNEPNIRRTFSFSTSERVRSSATVGSELSSTEMKRSLRPLMPPRA
jgi:hypothetical protein